MIPHYNTAIVGRRRDAFSVTSAFYMLEVFRDALRGGATTHYRLCGLLPTYLGVEKPR